MICSARPGPLGRSGPGDDMINYTVKSLDEVPSVNDPYSRRIPRNNVVLRLLHATEIVNRNTPGKAAANGTIDRASTG